MSAPAAAAAFARASFTNCAAALAPVVGVELGARDAQLAPESAPPEGDLAVLPLALESGGRTTGVVCLYGPLAALVGLARRTRGDPDPDKERELSTDDLEALGQVLGLCAGALEAAARAQLSPELRAKPGPWWRSADPAGNSFASGPHVVARSGLALPGGSEVPLFLRFSEALLAEASDAKGGRRGGPVLLFGFDDTTRDALSSPLAKAGFEVHAEPLAQCQPSDAIGAACAVLVAGDGEGALEACRRLRLGNQTWRAVLLVCLREPTRERVLEALAHGASHVLRIPAEDAALLRVLEDARV
jgi:CheY-like chemotaxis protein